MAEIKGCGGAVTFTNLTAGAKSWTLNWTNTPLDTTDFADNCAKTAIAGFTEWNATVVCNWDAANTADPGDSATLTLKVTSALNYAGTALLTGITVNTAVDGVVEATYTFQGNGTLTPTLA